MIEAQHPRNPPPAPANESRPERRNRPAASPGVTPALLLALIAVLAAGCGSMRNTASASSRIASRYITSAKTVLIGRSARGRAITAQVLGPDTALRKILLVGCIHGNECAGIAILSALARVPPPGGVQLWLVREMNPDGTAADTRQNARGVDLNRNFPFRWRAIFESTYYSGPHPLSEPEARAAVKLIRAIKPSVTIWYHQHEDLVDMAGGDRGIARRYAQLAGLRATCLPFLPGTATAWSNHSFPGTTAFVVELPAGPVDARALRRHLHALRAVEQGGRVGPRTRCRP